MFLQGAGGYIMAIPLLPSLLPRQLWAATNDPIKRYIAICSDFGYGRHTNWYPTNAAPTLTFNGGERAPIKYKRLKDYISGPTDPFSPIFGADLNPYLQDSLLLRGLDIMPRIGHSGGAGLGNIRPDQENQNSFIYKLKAMRTIDQVLNASSKFNPNHRDVAIMGIGRNNFNGSHSWKKVGTEIIKAKPAEAKSASNDEASPKAVFKRLFPVPMKSGTGTVTDPNVALLNGVMADYNATLNSSKISATDKAVLEQVGDLMNELKLSKDNPTPLNPACDSASIADMLTSLQKSATVAEDQRRMNDYVKVLMMAMICDQTRTAVLSSGVWTQRDESMSSHFGFVADDTYHNDITHHPNERFKNKPANKYGYELIAEYNRWAVTGYLKPLLSAMSNFTDPANGKSMLYNSIVHMSNEHSLTHGNDCLPNLLVGQAGGYLKTGWLVEYMDRTAATLDRVSLEGFGYSDDKRDPLFHYMWPGLQQVRLFATIFQAMGLAPADYKEQPPPGYLGTKDGYGMVNAIYPGKASYWAYDKGWNDSKNAKYDWNRSGTVLPFPSSSAPD
jgi:hypothetical protein